MNEFNHDEDYDPEFGGRISPLLEPQAAACDLTEDENNNTLPLSRQNPTNYNRSSRTSRVTGWNLTLLIYPLLSHAYDIVTDIYVAVGYFASQKNVHGSLTLALILIPALICTWISCLMHDEDSLKVQAEQQDGRDNYLQKIEALKSSSVMVILFQLPLPLRRLLSLCYAWEVRQCEQKGDNDGREYYYSKMQKEQVDLALLNVIEGCLESAAQLIVQLTILPMEDGAMTTRMWLKIVGGCFTLVSLGWSMRNYHRAKRWAQSDENVITCIHSALLFIRHSCTIGAHIFIITIAARNWPIYTLLACTLIWIGWTAYLNYVVFRRIRTVSSSIPPMLPDKRLTLFFAAVLGQVYMFTFVNLEKGRTRTRLTIYYVLCMLQNIIVLALWFIFASQSCEDVCSSKLLPILSVIFYMIGIAATVLYYSCCHHNVQIVYCATRDETR